MKPHPSEGMNEISDSAASARESSRQTDGKFGSAPTPEADQVTLGAPGGSDGGVELQARVDHPDWKVRLEAATHPDLSADQARRLADPRDQHPVVRQAAARSLYPGSALRASRDPDPLVRMVSRHGWDLPGPDRERLYADPDIAGIEQLLGRSA